MAATAVVAATGLTGVVAGTAGVSAWGAESTVTRIGDLPPEASVSRSVVPAGERALQIEKKHKRQAARAARLARARATREAREADEERASRARSYGSDPRGVAAGLAASQYGWAADQFGCLDALWTRESGWDPHAQNPSSGAYGIPQALPGSKMGAYGSDWADNPTTQIRWGLAYISGSYGTPCGAWSEFQSQGWY
ncbi:MAG TPA: lytic transglycosylase domain-containing protein [Actinomycetes bacterium]|nr:lytic transglycosylase domain-containing protein [Actinomycetes bacterium]